MITIRKLLIAGLLAVTPALAQYVDVPPDHWAAPAIEELSQLGVLKGYPDGTFRGRNGITRYETAMALWRLLRRIREHDRAFATREALAVLARAVQELSQQVSLYAGLEDRLRALEAAAANPGLDRTAVGELRRDLATLARGLNALADRISRQDARVKGLENATGALRQELDAFKTRLDAIWGALDALNAYIAGEGRDRREIREALAALESRLAALEGRLASLDRKTARLEALETRVRALEGKLKGVAADVDRKLAEKTAALKQELKPRIKAGGRVSAGAGAFTGAGLDADRLFPDLFSTPATRGPEWPDARPLTYRGRADLTLSARNFTLTAGLSLFAAEAHLARLDLRHEQDGLTARLRYRSPDATFALTPYLLANANAGGLDLSALTLEATAGAYRFLGVLGRAEPNALDPNPAFTGGFYGAAWGAGPVTLAVGGTPGKRLAFSALARVRAGPVEVEGAWASSAPAGSPPAAYLDPAGSDWAYHVRVRLGDALSAAYFAVDPDYADGVAGLSEAADLDRYRGSRNPGFPAGERGVEAAARRDLGAFSVRAFARLWEDYRTAASSQALASRVEAGLGAWSIGVTAARAYTGGTGLTGFGPAAAALGRYRYADPEQRFASVYAADLRYRPARGRQLLAAARYYLPGHLDTELAAVLDPLFEAGGLRAAVGGRWHRFAGTGSAPAYNTLKAWGDARFSIGPAFARVFAAWRGTRYTRPAAGYAEELLLRAEAGVRDLAWPGSELRVGWARYRGLGLPGSGPILTGEAALETDPRADGLFFTLAAPWAFLPGNGQADQSGLYGSFSLSGWVARAATFWGNGGNAAAFGLGYTASF